MMTPAPRRPGATRAAFRALGVLVLVVALLAMHGVADDHATEMATGHLAAHSGDRAMPTSKSAGMSDHATADTGATVSPGHAEMAHSCCEAMLRPAATGVATAGPATVAAAIVTTIPASRTRLSSTPRAPPPGRLRLLQNGVSRT